MPGFEWIFSSVYYYFVKTPFWIITALFVVMLVVAGILVFKALKEDNSNVPK